MGCLRFRAAKWRILFSQEFIQSSDVLMDCPNLDPYVHDRFSCRTCIPKPYMRQPPPAKQYTCRLSLCQSHPSVLVDRLCGQHIPSPHQQMESNDLECRVKGKPDDQNLLYRSTQQLHVPRVMMSDSHVTAPGQGVTCKQGMIHIYIYVYMYIYPSQMDTPYAGLPY